MSATGPYPLQRNQQPYIVIGGVVYNWNPQTGQYVDATGRATSATGTNPLQQGQLPQTGPITGPLKQPDPNQNPAPTKPSYDPAGGGPTYTPGISFGAGVIPGQGDHYQRQWFDVGNNTHEGVDQAFYNDPGNWGYAWDKVLNQFGGQVGGDFYKFLQGFSNTAKGDYQNSVPYDPNLNVSNFLDQYAPAIKGVWGLLPSAQTHGGTGALSGRSVY